MLGKTLNLKEIKSVKFSLPAVCNFLSIFPTVETYIVQYYQA